MTQKTDKNRREYHRLEFDAGIAMHRLDDALIGDPGTLRSRLRSELRMLKWLQLDNQYAFVRDSALRSQPALAPLVSLMEARINFLAGEIFVKTAVSKRTQRIQMSATGIAFDWSPAIEPGSLWLLQINPEGADPALSLPAVIQRRRIENNGEEQQIAAHFFALTEDETDALASWIVARQARTLSQQQCEEN